MRCLFLLLLPAALFAEMDSAPNQMLYLIHTGEIETALNQYVSYARDKGKHDFELLQQLSLILLDKGVKSRSPEIQLMTIFGAGIATNEKAFYLLEEGLNSSYPEIQAIALNFLAKSQNDLANPLINRLLSSPYPLLRLEAAYQLALKKNPLATSQIEALMYKVNEEAAPIFPKLFALSGDLQAIKILRKLLSHPDGSVRSETVLALAETGRDDLLPNIRKLSTHHDVAQQEACAYAFGLLKDSASIPLLKKFTRASSAAVRIAAVQALHCLGDTASDEVLIQLAKKGDIFAISALEEIPDTEDELAILCKNPNLQIRINAAWALLQKKDSRCLPALLEILIRDARDLAFVSIYSLGRSLSAIKAIPSAIQNFEETPLLHELSLSYREEILEDALELPEKDFLKLAACIFDARQNDLIPMLADLLVNLDTPGSIALLKKEQQKTGAPLIRNYCNLALFKMGEEGFYEETVREWIKEQKNVDLMRFRTFVPFDKREKESVFQLTPQESARLLIESFEAIAQTQKDEGIDLLLEALIYGNPQNRFVLAGLLLRATQ